MFVFPALVARLPRSRYVGYGLRVVYEDGRGILRDVLAESTSRGFSVARLETHQLEHEIRGAAAVAVNLEVQGQPTPDTLVAALHDLDGVLEVTATDLARGDE